MRDRVWLAASLTTVVALAIAGRPASAQVEPSWPPPLLPDDVGQPLAQGAPPPPPWGLHDRRDDWYPRSGTGSAVLLGGGFGNLRQDADNARTGTGGSWALRLVSGTRLPIAWEAAYVGSAHDINGPGVEEEDYLLRNGVEGVLRFNLPIVNAASLVAPFGFAGLGWNRLDIVHADAAVTLPDEDHQFVIPLGAGVAVGHRGFFADARFTYRQAFDDEMFGPADMSHWNLGIHVGAEF